MAQTAAQLGIKAPAGGFKDGGWYSGRNYDAASGTFGEPNQIWSKALPQSGTYVGAEVRAQSAVAQGVSPQQFDNYLKTQGATQPQQLPQSTKQVQQVLNDFGAGLFSAASNLPGVQSFDEIAKGLKESGILPNTPPPTAPSLVEQFQELSDAKGVDAIQASITELKASQDQIASQLQVTKTAEKNKPVAQNVISGRISQETQEAQDQYDFIGRQLARKQDELTSTLGNIQMIMQFTQQDYQNASASYNTQFDQAITTFNLIHGIQQDQKTDAQRAQDNARANLTIMVNAITSGNLSLSNLAPDQQAQLNKLEVQVGLPIGFMQSLQMDPSKSIIYTGKADNGQIQVLSRNADGTMSMQNYGTASSSTSNTKALTATQNSLKNDVSSKMTLDSVMKKYGNSLSPDFILSTYNQYSPFGVAKESLATLQKKYNVSSGSTTASLSAQDKANVNTIKNDISNGYYTREEAVSTYPEYAPYL